MLSEARRKSNLVEWSRLDVERTGYESGFFDAAMCSLAIHHFRDLSRAFEEVARVIRPSGRFVVFTSTSEQMEGYWLNEYFPEMMVRSRQKMPSLEAIRNAMSPNALVIQHTRPFFVTAGLQDLFLYSGKQRPEMYFDPKVRDGISSFRSLCTDHELEDGLARLAGDIKTDRFRDVMNHYDNDAGDYLFVIASKEEE